jgi:hypothetical protein
MVTIEKGDLVCEQGRILGRLERWDIPAALGRRCHECNQLVPVTNWEYHQHACHEVGWGNFRDPLANPKAIATKRRSKVDFVAELAKLLK